MIRIKIEKKWKTTFRIKYEFYEYLIISFELINASIICQNIINDTLREYLDIIVVIYLNNILVFSKTLKEHKMYVKRILKALSEKNFFIQTREMRIS